MKDVVVIGAGKIGATVARLLASTDDYRVTLADRSAEVFDRLDRDNRIRTTVADVEDSSKLIDLLNGQCAVLNAGPFYLTIGVAEAARAAGIDLAHFDQYLPFEWQFDRASNELRFARHGVWEAWIRLRQSAAKQ
jgi:saccharopine dehydrogenase-like NADP-dependent oxidoreductase